MEDKKILANMMKKVTGFPKRTAKCIEVGNGVFDDYVHPNASTNAFYQKWIKLVADHNAGGLELRGRFKRATGFISFASQFNESFIPTTILLGRTCEFMDETNVSFLDPTLYSAIKSKNAERINLYVASRGDWNLSEEEKVVLQIMEHTYVNA